MTGPSPVVLRRMRWWDVPAVHALEVQLFDPDTWSVETFWSELAAEGRDYLVAEEPGGDLLGYAGLAVAGADADVQTVAVGPWAQGRGVGRTLVRALVGQAARRGSAAVLLEVRADNAPAIGLYSGLGFERIAVRRRYYEPGGIDAHVMRLRPLPPAPAAPPLVG